MLIVTLTSQNAFMQQIKNEVKIDLMTLSKENLIIIYEAIRRNKELYILTTIIMHFSIF